MTYERRLIWGVEIMSVLLYTCRTTSSPSAPRRFFHAFSPDAARTVDVAWFRTMWDRQGCEEPNTDRVRIAWEGKGKRKEEGEEKKTVHHRQYVVPRDHANVPDGHADTDALC